MKLTTLTAAIALAAGAASAATITTSAAAPAGGLAINLDPADFAGSGRCGYGSSVVGDGCAVVRKSDPSAPDAFGRFDPLGGSWIDSQDLARVDWTVRQDTPFTAVRFALTDAFDQRRHSELGASHFQLSAAGATWSIANREANGTLHWIEVLLDAPTRQVTLRFDTRLNDGWGVSSASVAPVPLPAAAWLLIAGVAVLGLAARRRRADG